MPRRPGNTIKLSISLSVEDVDVLRRRADEHFHGNVSAAITELIRLADEERGREELAAWLGEPYGELDQATMDRIHAEWTAKPRSTRRRTRSVSRTT